MLWTKPSNLRSDLVVAILRSPDHKQEYLLHHSAFQTLRPHDWLFGEVCLSGIKYECQIVHHLANTCMKKKCMFNLQTELSC